MNSINQQEYEQTVAEAAAVYDMVELMESYISEAEKAYEMYAYWHDELGHDAPIVQQLHTDWRYARQRAEDIYASMA